jgi:hypothetical protein
MVSEIGTIKTIWRIMENGKFFKTYSSQQKNYIVSDDTPGVISYKQVKRWKDVCLGGIISS